MSQALPSASNCCYPCAEPVITTTPGPQGDAGADGADGADGLNAYTLLTSGFTMPAELANVTVAVANSDWMTVGQKVFIGKLSSAARGTFEVISKPDSAHAILENMEDTPNSAYVDNSAPGTVFPNGSAVSPSGLQGPKGVDGTSGAPTTAHYVTTQAEAGLSAEFSLGTLTTGLLKHTVAAGVSTPATAIDGADYLSPTTGLEPGDIGTTVQGWDALTDAIAALAMVADRMIYGTGANTVALTPITAQGRTLVAYADAAATLVGLGRVKERSGLLGLLTVNLNGVVGDQNVPVTFTRAIIRKVVLEAASVNLAATATRFGLYTGSGKTGSAIVTDPFDPSALTAATKWIDVTLAAGVGTDVVIPDLVNSRIYFYLSVAHGVAATAKLWVFGEDLS